MNERMKVALGVLSGRLDPGSTDNWTDSDQDALGVSRYSRYNSGEVRRKAEEAIMDEFERLSKIVSRIAVLSPEYERTIGSEDGW